MRGCINVVVVLPRGINIISCFMLQKLTMSAVVSWRASQWPECIHPYLNHFLLKYFIGV